MASEWIETRLGDVAQVNPDTIDRDWPHSYIKYIDISSVSEGSIDTTPLRMALKDAPSRAKRLVRTGDTVISTVRPNRRSMFFVNQPCNDWVVSTGFAVLRPNEKRINPRYLYECAFNHDFTEYLVTREKGAAYPAVSTEDITDALIPLPPLPEQRAIAHILGTLDDKIELNRRTNETLEAIARALFKSWFVDFDPVRAKAAGRTPEGMEAATAALFPDSFEDSELGEVPKGWKVDNIYRLADVIYGAPFQSSLFTQEPIGKPLIRIRDLETHNPTINTPEQHSRGYLVQPGDLIVGMDCEFRAHMWHGPEAWLNQRLCCFKPKIGVPRARVHYSIENSLDFFERSKTGTTVIHLGKSDIDTFRVLIPPPKLVTFGMFVDSIDIKIVTTAAEIRTLTALRDTLLPKLVNGELRVT